MDEIEKAHPDVFNILLQVLDDGRLTDGHGRTVDFRNTIIVMTSNLGSKKIQTMSEDTEYEDMKAMVLEIVSAHFRPEFINRIDDIVVFHTLKQKQIREIADIQIQRVEQRLHEQDIKIEVTKSAKDFLGKAGFDPIYGARPLKRAIQTYLETPLAEELLAGKYLPGNKIIVDIEGKDLTFTPANT